MHSSTTLPISEARKRIFEIARDLKKSGKHYTLTENGKPTIVLMSVEDFESWQETLNVIEEMPTLLEDIKQAEKDFKAGRYITIEDYLKKRGDGALAKKYAKKVHNNSNS